MRCGNWSRRRGAWKDEPAKGGDLAHVGWAGTLRSEFGTCLGVLGTIGERGGAWLTVVTGAAVLGLVLLVIGLALSFLSRR